jgi:hypothetical protein
VVSLAGGGCGKEKEVTPFRDWDIKFPLGEFPKTLKNEASIVIGKNATGGL